MNRRELLATAVVLPAITSSRLMRRDPAATGSRARPRWRALVRRNNVVWSVDPVSGSARSAGFSSEARRVRYLSDVARILIEMIDGSVTSVDPSGRTPGRTMNLVRASEEPVLPGGRMLVVADRGEGLRIYDLVTDRFHLVPLTVDQIPSVQVHPTRLAAVLDGRAEGGPVIVLPDDNDRTPWAADAPASADVALTGDGCCLLMADGAAQLSVRARDMPMSTIDGVASDGPLLLLGPLGNSGQILVEVGGTSLMKIDPQAPEPVVDDVGFAKAGNVGGWMSTVDGDNLLLGRDEQGTGRQWWYWRRGEAAWLLPDLPVNLTMAGRSGRAGRWFHGAVLSQASLGAGNLRLMTVDLNSGGIVFDEVVDRRLELAATRISDDGSVLAHVQAGNTGVEMLVASFGEETARETFRVDIEDVPVAAAEIVLDVAGNARNGIVAAGLQWGNPDHHAPIVLMSVVVDGESQVPMRIDGELIGVVPATAM